MNTQTQKSAAEVSNKNFLNWHDIANMFGCGKSKAMLIINEVGPVHIGQVSFIKSTDLEDYLNEHGEIQVKWPMSAKRRKERKHG